MTNWATIRWALVGVVLLAAAFWPLPQSGEAIRIGSKKFTESVLIGDIATLLVRDAGLAAAHLREMGGSRILFDAVIDREIDAYADYTGTIRRELLADEQVETDEQLRAALAARGLLMTEPLGFNNTYAIAVTRETADELGLARISDLARRPDLRLAFSNEFMDREDGWPGLRRAYGLPQTRVSGMDHDLAYRQLASGGVDVIDAYVTDGRIDPDQIVLLEDDRQYFPRYDAVLLYSAETADQYPAFQEALTKLEGALDDERITSLNRRVDVGGEWEGEVSTEFLHETFGVTLEVTEPTTFDRLLKHTVEHVDLVRRSLLPAILVAIPLGIIAAKTPGLGALILGVVGVVQTIPALALLVFLMPVVAWAGLSSVGAGSTTAIAALFLYSLLPIVRNTTTGLESISPSHRESASALGVSSWFRLTRIELPLAAPTILAGIKTATVLNIGFATLGALIGAGGYGQPILSGIRLNDMGLIMLGAAPAAAMAILAQVGFSLAERWLMPRGLRIA